MCIMLWPQLCRFIFHSEFQLKKSFSRLKWFLSNVSHISSNSKNSSRYVNILNLKYVISFECNVLLLSLLSSFWVPYLQSSTPASTWLLSFLVTVIRKIAIFFSQFTVHQIIPLILFTLTKFYICMYGDVAWIGSYFSLCNKVFDFFFVSAHLTTFTVT